MSAVFPKTGNTTMSFVSAKDNVALKIGRGRVFILALTGEYLTSIIIIKLFRTFFTLVCSKVVWPSGQNTVMVLRFIKI